jgi:hypothetical protein
MNFGLQSLVSDISISMFKVAAVINHPGLKSELEILAISLAVDPCPENIFSAENLINLGREVGEVKSVNAVVLIRELENLRKNMSAISPISPVGDVDISTKFIHKNVDINSTSSSHSSSASSRPSADGTGAQDVQVSSDTRTTNSSAPKRTRPNAGRKSSLNSDKVYQYIVEHKEAKLKELESVFSEVSGRTVRRMTDALIKEGKIERVGNPGPTSYYRLISSPVISTSQFYKENDVPESSSVKPDPDHISESAPQFSYEEPDGYSDVIAL